MARELMNDYLDYTQRQHVMKRSSETSIGKFLHRIVPKVRHFRRRGPVAFLHEGEIKRQVMRMAFYQISSLKLCRTQWVKLHGRHMHGRRKRMMANPELRKRNCRSKLIISLDI